MRTSWVSFTEKYLEEAQVQDWEDKIFLVRNKDTCVWWVLLLSHLVLNSLVGTLQLTGNAADGPCTSVRICVAM